MRYSILVWVLVLASTTGCPAEEDEGVAFSFTSENIVIQPGAELVYCYYFHTPNTAPVAINRWVSDMTTPGSHHMIFFTGGVDHADGLDTTNSCGLDFNNLSANRTWVFATQIAHNEQLLPKDDGTGKPLAQLIQPNTLGVFQMHYINTTDAELTVNVQLTAYGLPAGTQYTQTDAFITYNEDISIPPRAANMPVTGSCTAPPGKFWNVSTHAHKQAAATEVKDGPSVVFQSTDWEHPGEQTWMQAPYYTFASNKVTWTCTYTNMGGNADRVVEDGESASVNEMCMTAAYYFPSVGPKFCIFGAARPDGCECN